LLIICDVARFTSTLSFSEHETYFERVSEVQRLVDQLPEPNKRMLEMLMSHLEKVKYSNIKGNYFLGFQQRNPSNSILSSHLHTRVLISTIK
jgi:nitrate reductase assembly molybdenum cofactor insertion protein NarJ